MQQFKYQQLAKTLKSQIDENNWQINEKLPSIRALANNFNVSKISVQKALHVLEAMDLIYVKPKSGYYVAARKNIQHISPEIQSISKPTKVDMPEVFYDIMERSAAFDIAPQRLNNSQTPSLYYCSTDTLIEH